MCITALLIINYPEDFVEHCTCYKLWRTVVRSGQQQCFALSFSGSHEQSVAASWGTGRSCLPHFSLRSISNSSKFDEKMLGLG